MILRIWFLLIFWINRTVEDSPEFERAHFDFNSSSMLIQTAANRMITLKGKVIVNGTDVSKLPSAKDWSIYEMNYGTLGRSLRHMEARNQYTEKYLYDILKTMQAYQQRVTKLMDDVESLQNWEINQMKIDETRKLEIERLQKLAEEMRRTLEKDFCEEEKPCKNGATCISQYGGFFCICQKEYQGDTCEADFDECATSELRCGKNGTCVNTDGGFECQCSKGFFGPACDSVVSECSTSNTLCGEHGACVTDTSKPNGYTCYCDPGYQPSHDLNNPICVDVNECHSNPCHPGVECLNLQGSFECKGCPPGFEKIGSDCQDIDECEKFEACDKRVKCENTKGSYHCGPCPKGFLGDPKTECRENPDKCDPNPCPKLATCTTTPDGKYACSCPQGYMGGTFGDGDEVDPCEKEEADSVHFNRYCLNGGTPRTILLGMRCDCPENSYGSLCENISPCFGKPCQNEGICKINNEKNRYCDCPKGYYGEDCEKEEDACDRHFSSPNGTFSFNRGGSTDCRMVFNINWDNNMALEVNFTDYDGFNSVPDGATNCSRTTGRLEIYDGPAVNYHKLAVFCGNQNDAFSPRINEPIKFSSTTAMFLFRGTSGKFDLSWSVQPKKCGYRTSAAEGVISIRDNKQDIACEWFIFAPATKVIQITIPPLTMFTGDKFACDQNELTLHDGYFKNDEVQLDQLCSNSEEVITRTTISSHLTVSFVSNLLQDNEVKSIPGFNLVYKFVDPVYPCGQEFVNTGKTLGFSGRIKSPNFGGLYPPNINCFYAINTTHDSELRVRFNVDLFDVLSDKDDDKFCNGDVLKVEGVEDNMYRFCNSNGFDPKLTMFTPYLVMDFSTNDKNQGRGFDIEFTVDCYKTFTGNGSFRTWNYPNGGLSGECTYVIEAAKHELVTLTFPPKYYEDYSCDESNFIAFRSGVIDNRFFGRKWCEYHMESPITVSGSLTIVLKQEESKKGWEFTYTTRDIGCDAYFTSDIGTITSPNYPNPPPNNLHCVYRIETSPDQSIVLTFDDIDMTLRDLDCNVGDRIEIYDGYDEEKQNGTLIRKVCGSQKLPPIYSETNKMVIKILTDHFDAGTGFSASYKVINSTSTCDRSFLSPSGVIEFSQNERQFQKCDFHIRVPDHNVMRITFNSMNMSRLAHLRMYNGRDEKAPLFNSEFGYHYDKPEKPFLSHSDHVFIQFIGRHSSNSSFKLTYEVVSKRCGGVIDALLGQVQTPQYPHVEKRILNCEWRIRVPPGNRIELKVKELDYAAGHWTDNSIKVYQYQRNERILLKEFQEANQTISSTDNTLILTYSQSYAKSFGFLADFDAFCSGIVLKEWSGAIETLQDVFLSCDWEIQVPMGNRIILHFHKFVIDQIPQHAINNRFEVNIDEIHEAEVNVNGSVSKISTVSVFNSSMVPISIRSKHNRMHLSFINEYPIRNKVYLTYETIGCVGDIKDPQDIIVTLDDLDPTSDLFECEYRITAPIGKKVAVNFNQFARNIPNNCQYEYGNVNGTGIAFFMGRSRESGHPYRSTCRYYGLMESHANEIYIYILLNKSDFVKRDDDNILINATVSFNEQKKDDECGGVVRLRLGQVAKVTSPTKLDDYSECNWRFEVPTGHHIEFTLEHYNSSYDDKYGCDRGLASYYGSLKIYDSDQAKEFCHSVESPETFEMDTMSSLVRYTIPAKTDINKGFTLTARPVCGGVMYAEENEQYEMIKMDEVGVCNITIMKKNESDDRIFLDFWRYHTDLNKPSTDSIKVFTDGDFKGIVLPNHNSTHSYGAQNSILLSVDHQSSQVHEAVIRYSANKRNCENRVFMDEGTITEPYSEDGEDIDCTWNIWNRYGNLVSFTIESHNLPKTPHCAESYIEIREEQVNGKVISRQCDPEKIDKTEFKFRNLFVILRYRPSQGNKLQFRGHYKIMGGGYTNSQVILPPVLRKGGLFTWTKMFLGGGRWKMGRSLVEKNVRIDIKRIKLEPDSYIQIGEIADNGEIIIRKTITSDDVDDTFITMRTSVMKFIAKSTDSDFYNITWETYNDKDRHRIAGFDCGYETIATWEWQTITAPRKEGALGYDSDVHCMWTINPPSLSLNQIEYEIEELNLGDEDRCESDYIYFTPDWGKFAEPHEKLCSMPKDNERLRRKEEETVALHFKSDRNPLDNNGTFRIKYRLSCGVSWEIPRSDGYQYEITSPNYPMSLNKPEECEWFLFGQSRRNLTVQIVDMDIVEDTPCTTKNSLNISSTSGKPPASYCGKLGTYPINYTSEHGHLTINYNAEASHRKGFKLLITEVMTECPGETIYLTEEMPSRWIYSPEHPGKIPISTACDYVVSVPHGHRVMLTFDPHEFNLANSENKFTDLDYIELRDGPNEHSPLIGKLQGHEAPPTKFTTSNFMFMRLSSGAADLIGGFAAKFEIARCGGSKTIYNAEEVHYITPPSIDDLKEDIECIWIVHSPNTHLLEMRFESLLMKYGPNCGDEALTVYNGNDSIFAEDCSSPDIKKWIRSSSSEITIKYKSTYNPNNEVYHHSRGLDSFKIAVRLSEIACGGEITNDWGLRYAPKAAGKLLQRVRCVWNFNASPGFRYIISISFEGKRNYYFYDSKNDKKCFPDLKILQKTGNTNRNEYVEQEFCELDYPAELSTPSLQLIYDDRPSRESRGTINESTFDVFHFAYTKIPIEDDSCSFPVNSSGTFNFNADVTTKRKSYFLAPPKIPELCQISIQKPKTYGTVSIKIDNFGEDYPFCSQSSLTFKSTGPVPLDDNYCEKEVMKKPIDFVYTNENIDLLIFQDSKQPERKRNFSVKIEFEECGGMITSSTPYGNISKPKSGSRCRWDFEAPVGQIIKLKVLSMNILNTLDCNEDRLVVREGKQDTKGLIHMYCHTMGITYEKHRLKEEFLMIRSKSRFLNIEWINNIKFDATAWVLEYTFINEGDECGFTSSALSGIIETPRFGISDYENNMECHWDIHVPSGYHIELSYLEFNVEPSANCTADALILIEAGQSSGINPTGNRYIQNHELMHHTPICGIHTPKDSFASSTKRLKMNFTTNERLTARGFRIKWEAKCGSILTKPQDIVTSPNYPHGYNHEHGTCGYVIQANDDDIVAIKFDDVDLPDGKKRKDCYSDHIKIVEVPTDKILLTICGNGEIPTEGLTFKGSIGINFWREYNFWVEDKTILKNYRGFKLSYQIYDCGRTIYLDGDESTIITSPAHPLLNKHALNCIWNITTADNRVLNFKLLDFDLGKTHSCKTDYIHLTEDGRLNHRYCSGENDVDYGVDYESLRSATSSVLIKFVTDAENNGRGFRMRVASSLGSNNGCGGTLDAYNTWETFQPPRDEKGNYFNHLHCVWYIQAMNWNSVQLRITDVDIEKSSRANCPYDSLKILDGWRGTSPLLYEPICGSNSPINSINSTTGHVTVIFKTDEGGVAKGFNISYIMHNTKCEQHLEVQDKPQTYQFNISTNTEESHEKTCTIFIDADKNKPMVITFTRVDFATCADGSIEMQDYGENRDCMHSACARKNAEHRIIKSCGDKKIMPFVAVTNTVQMHIRAKSSVKAGAVEFTYQYYNKCNRTINTTLHGSGRLTSPNFPHDFDGDTDCTININGSSKKTLLIFQSHVSNLAELSVPKKDPIKPLPQTYFAEAGDINITMKHQNGTHQKGYDATYYTVSEVLDDGTIVFADNFEPNGIVTNIGYPNGYANSTTEQFTLRPPSQTQCLVVFEIVNINIKSDCKTGSMNDEYVSFETSHGYGKINNCDERPAKIYLDQGDEHRFIKIIFKSDNDASNDGRGFKATWRCDNKLNFKVNPKFDVPIP